MSTSETSSIFKALQCFLSNFLKTVATAIFIKYSFPSEVSYKNRVKPPNASDKRHPKAKTDNFAYSVVASPRIVSYSCVGRVQQKGPACVAAK